jgi:hypothetical protein
MTMSPLFATDPKAWAIYRPSTGKGRDGAANDGNYPYRTSGMNALGL